MKKNSIIHFSDASMLAIHALVILSKDNKNFFTTKQMAQTLGASENHLAKIMQILAKNRYVESIKGPSGGFILSVDPEKITLKSVIELIEGPLDSSFCPFFKNCPSSNCILGPQIKDYSEKIIKFLEEKNIKQVALNSIFQDLIIRKD